MALALVAGLALPARGQDDENPWDGDPYFKGDREAWVAAGYAPVRRFGFGDGHGSADVEQLLGELPLLWVETAHFRLGSTLPEVKITRDERARVQAELERLAERLPRLKKGVKTLDRHLRLHLYAQRLEDLYAEFEALLVTADADGAAPYLGLGDKLPVLLLETSGSLARYGNRWGTPGPPSPQRLFAASRGTLGFVTTWEFFEGKWQVDQALHAHVVWNVSQNLLNGYRGYTHVSPAWFQYGLASWFARRVSERHPSYPRLEGSSQVAADAWDWPPKVRARVGFGVFATMEQMLAWRHGEAREATDVMMAWSKVDWLMSRDEGGGLGPFVEALSAPIPCEPGTAPTEEQVAERCTEALQQVWGLSPEAFDEGWAAWVQETYPRS